MCFMKSRYSFQQSQSMRNTIGDPVFLLNAKQIKVQDEVKLLGVTVDRKLLWHKQIAVVKRKCASAVTVQFKA